MLLKGFLCIGTVACTMFVEDVPDQWTSSQCLRNGAILAGMHGAGMPFSPARTSHSFGCTEDGEVVAATYAIQPGLRPRDRRDIERRISGLWAGYLHPAGDAGRRVGRWSGSPGDAVPK